jgi:hypothetical protein
VAEALREYLDDSHSTRGRSNEMET